MFLGPRIRFPLGPPQHLFARQCLKADGRAPNVQPLDSFPFGFLHCTVRLCQPVSQVLEHVIQAPVTQRGPGVGVEGPGAVGTLGTRTEGAVEDVVVVLVVVLVVLCTGVDFGLEMSGADGCCGAVRRGMKKL